MIIERINELLKTNSRDTTGDDRFVACGSCGDRVWGFMEKRPGLCGVFHFLHRNDLRDLLEVSFVQDSMPRKLKTEYEWRPSHLSMLHTYQSFFVKEEKYITEDDMVVTDMTIGSISDRVRLRMELHSGFLGEDWSGSIELFGFPVEARLLCSLPEVLQDSGLDIALEAGGEFSLRLAIAFRMQGEGMPAEIPDLASHIIKYGKFFEGIPALCSSDKDLEKVYYYRWFLLRYNYANPRAGNLKYPLFYEGRQTCYPIGEPADPVLTEEQVHLRDWEFSRAIACSSFHHTMDARWAKDLSPALGEIMTFALSGAKICSDYAYYYDSPLMATSIRAFDFIGHYLFHLLPLAAWRLYLFTGDKEWLSEVAPGLWEDLLAWAEFDKDGSGLPLMVFEGDTAMEFGAASHYCNEKLALSEGEYASSIIGTPSDYRKGNAVWGGPFPNRRTELAVFYGLNYMAFSNIFLALGDDKKACECAGKVKTIKDSMAKYMWDDACCFFVELTETYEKIPDIWQAGGLFSLMLVDPPSPDGFLSRLTDPGRFGQKYGTPTLAEGCFGFFSNNTVNGDRKHSCMWNGPVWPYSTSFYLRAIADYINRNSGNVPEGYREYFQDQFRLYTDMHFLFEDKDHPCIVEHYDPVSGNPLSWQDDYNHSGFIDLFIQYACGFHVDSGEVFFNPIGFGNTDVELTGINYKGAVYDVIITGNEAKLYKNGEIYVCMSRP